MQRPLIFTLLTLILSACQAINLAPLTDTQPSGSVLFQDDFSDPTSGWQRIVASQAGTMDYISSAYHIAVSQPQTILFAGPQLTFKNIRLEFDAIQATGPLNNQFGAVCRAQDAANFYFLAISSDGYFGIGKVKDGVPALLTAEGLLPSEEILQGSQTNHLRVDCTGARLSLYVNGGLLAEAEDTEFESGRAGLFVGNFEEPGAEILFDNFSVIKP